MARIIFNVYAICDDWDQIDDTYRGLNFIKNVELVDFKDNEDRKFYLGEAELGKEL